MYRIPQKFLDSWAAHAKMINRGGSQLNMSPSFYRNFTLSWLLAVSFQLLGGRATAQDDILQVKDQLPLSNAFVPNSGSWKEYRDTPIHWNGMDYAPKDAAAPLAQVIASKSTKAPERMTAIGLLSTVANQLAGSESILSILKVYETVDNVDEQTELLLVLAKAEDPRAFSLFARILESEPGTSLRFAGAIGLAKWNIRTGVRELIGLTGSKAQLKKVRAISDESLKTIFSLNEQKGWGIPEKKIETMINSKVGISQEEKRMLVIDELHKWFSENEHRFPDWKPGDPLPSVEFQAPSEKPVENP